MQSNDQQCIQITVFPLILHSFINRHAKWTIIYGDMVHNYWLHVFNLAIYYICMRSSKMYDLQFQIIIESLSIYHNLGFHKLNFDPSDSEFELPSWYIELYPQNRPWSIYIYRMFCCCAFSAHISISQIQIIEICWPWNFNKYTYIIIVWSSMQIYYLGLFENFHQTFMSVVYFFYRSIWILWYYFV